MPLFSDERNDRNEISYMGYRDDIRVGTEGDGGLNTYYPVRLRKQNFENENRIDYVQIFRRFSATGPSAHGDHKAGLGTFWHGTTGGGNTGPRLWYCDTFDQTYRRTLGGAEIWNGSDENGIFFYLRGGGYIYTFRCSCPFDLTIYLAETLVDSAGGNDYYAVPRSSAEINTDGDRIGTGNFAVYSSGTLSGSFRNN